MKSNVKESPLRIYSTIPILWKEALRPKNYNNQSPDVHFEDGFRDVVIPNFNSETQYRGSLIYDSVNEIVTYTVMDYTPDQLAQKAEQALDSDGSAQKLNQAISDGQIMYQRFFAEIQRLFDNGTITGNQAKNSAQLLFIQLLPINYGQFQLAKINLDGLIPPVNAKELAILNKAKEHINNYLNKI